MLIAEPLARAPDPAHHLVYVDQDFVALADVLHPLPITLGRRDDTASGSNWFEADRTDRVRALAQNDLFEDWCRANRLF